MKTALVIHGFPQRFEEDHILFRCLNSRGYTIVAPYLLTGQVELDKEAILGHLLSELGENEPDLIVGISMGGLLAPYITEKFPETKMLLIASGCKFAPKAKVLRSILSKKYLLGVCWRLLKFIPYCVKRFVYKRINPFSPTSVKKTDYDKDLEINLKYIDAITSSVMQGLSKLILEIDNTSVLSRITNSCLILSGKEDVLMPLQEAELVHQYVSGSRLVVVQAGHFDVITQGSMQYIDQFITE